MLGDASVKVLHMCNVSRYTGDREDSRWAWPDGVRPRLEREDRLTMIMMLLLS